MYQGDSCGLEEGFLLLTTKYTFLEANSFLSSQEKKKRREKISTRMVRKLFLGLQVIFYEDSSAVSIRN